MRFRVGVAETGRSGIDETRTGVLETARSLGQQNPFPCRETLFENRGIGPNKAAMGEQRADRQAQMAAIRASQELRRSSVRAAAQPATGAPTQARSNRLPDQRQSPPFAFDCGAVDPLLAAHDRRDGEPDDNGENQGGDAAGRLDEPLTGAIAEDAFAPQRQRAQQAADQAGEIVVVAPGRQGEGLEAPHELVIGAQRVARRLRADADQRDPQFVAEKAQHVQEIAPARAPCQPGGYGPRR